MQSVEHVEHKPGIGMGSSSGESSFTRRTARLEWDRIGIGLSGLCAVHCLLTPFLLAFLPLWPFLGTAHAWLHPTFVVLLLPVTGLVARDAHRHGDVTPVSILLAIGFVLIAGAWVGHDVWGPIGEVAGTLVGSGLLITGHAIHWRRHRAAREHAASKAHHSTPA